MVGTRFDFHAMVMNDMSADNFSQQMDIKQSTCKTGFTRVLLCSVGCNHGMLLDLISVVLLQVALDIDV